MRARIAGLPSRLLLAALLGAGIGAGAGQAATPNASCETHQARTEQPSPAERRRIEGQRGDASRQLRDADEQVGRSSRALRETETAMAREQRDAGRSCSSSATRLQAALGEQREELARLLRAAYALGDAAPLKLLLAQDRVADASRALAYHRYLQRDRARAHRRLGTAAARAGRARARDRRSASELARPARAAAARAAGPTRTGPQDSARRWSRSSTSATRTAPARAGAWAAMPRAWSAC